MNQIGKALCFVLITVSISSVNYAEAQKARRGQGQEQVAQKGARTKQLNDKRKVARERVLKRLEARGFTRAEIKRAREVMRAVHEIKREGRSKARSGRGAKKRPQAARSRAGQQRAGRGGARRGQRAARSGSRQRQRAGNGGARRGQQRARGSRTRGR